MMKTRAAFSLVTTPLTRISRQVCKDILQISRAVRRPFELINIALIKQECTSLPPLWQTHRFGFF
jgi:metastasis-associated protein MTA